VGFLELLVNWKIHYLFDLPCCPCGKAQSRDMKQFIQQLSELGLELMLSKF